MASARLTALAPPGAGLPPLEHALIRALFFLMRKTMARATASARFQMEARRMVELVTALEEGGGQMVLIQRVAGIEDSSRNWSAWMTLAHLVVVDRAIMGIIEQLVAGKSIDLEVRTENVKPDPRQSVAVIEAFEKTALLYQKKLDSLGSLQTSQKHRHPWFGELNAHEWHCLAAIHHSIHRRQVERIARTAAV